jgi:hypothetical protein
MMLINKHTMSVLALYFNLWYMPYSYNMNLSPHFVVHSIPAPMAYDSFDFFLDQTFGVNRSNLTPKISGPFRFILHLN